MRRDGVRNEDEGKRASRRFWFAQVLGGPEMQPEQRQRRLRKPLVFDRLARPERVRWAPEADALVERGGYFAIVGNNYTNKRLLVRSRGESLHLAGSFPWLSAGFAATSCFSLVNEIVSAVRGAEP
jgi:hypothetical protein